MKRKNPEGEKAEEPAVKINDLEIGEEQLSRVLNGRYDGVDFNGVANFDKDGRLVVFSTKATLTEKGREEFRNAWHEAMKMSKPAQYPAPNKPTLAE